MKTLTLKMWVHAKPSENWELGNTNLIDGFTYNVYGFEPDGCIGQATVTIEMADDFDPRAGVVAALKEKRTKAMADFQSMVTEIDRQIAQYTALEAA